MAGIPKKLKLILRRVHYPALVLILYGVIAISLLSPIASTSTIPALPDFAPHLGHIIQAKLALDEGQLPLRVAPWQYQGWQYPVFQFYGQVLYTWAGAIYKFLTPSDPILAVLLLLWAAFVISGYFIYLTSLQLVRSRVAAILAGVSYMFAPYFLVNIYARGAIAEAVAQGLLPVVLYCVVQCYTTPKRRYVIAGAIAWFCLIGTHTITFVYGSLFIALWIGLTSIRGLRYQRSKTVRSLLRMIAAYLLGCLLSAYYLAPVILQTDVRMRAAIKSMTNAAPLYKTNWITPLPTLLQPTSLPPEPQLGPFQIYITPNLHAAVGWILLGAWLTVVCYYFNFKPKNPNLDKSYDLVPPLLLVFGLAFFMTWSPVNFWQFLPATFVVAQFTYRILTHTMWSGALLVACALTSLFKRLEGRHLVVGILLIGMASSSYLPKLSSLAITVEQHIQSPDLGYGQDAYLHNVDQLNVQTETQALPDLVDEAGQLRLNSEQTLYYSQPFDTPQLRLNITIPPAWAAQTVILSTFINDQVATKLVIQVGGKRGEIGPEFNIRLLPVDTLPARIRFAVETANATTGAINPGGKLPPIQVQSVPIIKELPASFKFIPVSKSQQFVQRKGLRMIAQMEFPDPSNVIQLPFLYYSNLLEARVDDKPVDYAALPYKNYALVSLNVPQGVHKVRVLFVGLGWANWCSLLTAIALLLYSTFIIVKRTKMNLKSGSI